MVETTKKGGVVTGSTSSVILSVEEFKTNKARRVIILKEAKGEK